MSGAQEIVDDFIYHAHMQERFKTAQAKKVRRHIKQLNNAIADYLKKKRTLETRKDYARTSRWVKEQTGAFAEQLLAIIEKDVRRQFRAEKEWLRGAFPDMKNFPSEDAVVSRIFLTPSATMTLLHHISTIRPTAYSRCGTAK